MVTMDFQVEEGTEKQKAEAEARNKRMQELNKFIHYYSRFKNHENSYKVRARHLFTICLDSPLLVLFWVPYIKKI